MAKKKQSNQAGMDANHALAKAVAGLFDWQKQALQSDNRYIAVMAHRGAGKSAMLSVTASLYALQMQPNAERMQQHRVFLILGQSKAPALNLYGPMLENLLAGFITESQLSVNIPQPFIKLVNGNIIYIDGLTDLSGDSLLGKSIDMCFIDEVGVIPVQKILRALLPTLTRPYTAGSLMVCGTPRGKSSGFFEFWTDFIDKVGGERIYLPIESELSPFGPDVKRTLELTTPPSIWSTEYQLNFSAGSDASVYSTDIDAIYEDGRLIKDQSMNFSAPTFIAMDLGFNDDTAIITYQVDIDGSPIIIDSYSNNRQPIETYIDYIASQSKMYNIRYVYLPHDSNAQVIGRANTVAGQFSMALSPLGIRVGILKKAAKVAYEIPIVKQVLKKTLVLERCKPMLEALREYSYAENADATGFTDIPANRQDDHLADAIRYFAMSYNVKYAGLTAENKADYVARGLISADYAHTREAAIADILKRANAKPVEQFRTREPIRIGRR